MILIIISSVDLALDNPLYDPNGLLKAIIYYADIVLTGIFVLEVLLKILAFGLLLNGP